MMARSRKTKRPPAPPRFSRAWFVGWIRSLTLAAVMLFFFRTFLFASFVITSGSMRETLLVGDFLLVNRMSLGSTIPFTDFRVPGYAEPEHGDIIVFRADHSPGLDIVKRTVGLPGDTLHMVRGVLYRNGSEVDEPYVLRNPRIPDASDARMLWQTAHLSPEARPGYHPTRDNWGPIVVPGERYFMLGDNRDDSFDSRFWGFVERKKMRGTLFFIYYSYDRKAPKPARFLTAMRPERIGPSPD
ncbi:signal peptidase I [Candidatus Palauibacter sp.]|uniref:signal peptidase I n=1 Tax=Candidatus Palauibacter sp. TaxID=3101350 RepID=UPI003B52A9BE